MKVLVACEFSGIVREAFKAKGHDAWSCDLLDTEIPGQHIQGDVLEVLNRGWDLMIAHPPCTYLTRANSKNYWPNTSKRIDALRFIGELINAPIDKIAIENPPGSFAKRIKELDPKVVYQVIQPWMFGHTETKTIKLHLWGLPILTATNIVDVRNTNLSPSGGDKLGPQVKDRWKTRSRTYVGIAEAMANQWG